MLCSPTKTQRWYHDVCWLCFNTLDSATLTRGFSQVFEHLGSRFLPHPSRPFPRLVRAVLFTFPLERHIPTLRSAVLPRGLRQPTSTFGLPHFGSKEKPCTSEQLLFEASARHLGHIFQLHVTRLQECSNVRLLRQFHSVRENLNL